MKALRIVGLITLVAVVALLGVTAAQAAQKRHAKRPAVGRSTVAKAATTKTTFARELVNGVVADREVVVVKNATVADSGLIQAQAGCFALTTPEPGVYAISNSPNGVIWYAGGIFRAPDNYAVQCYEPPISPVPFYVEVTRIGD
jgi:hypothetical protein